MEANKTLLTRNIEDKVVLITGSGGSIGSEISRQVVKNNPKKIILLDSNEYALFSIKNEIEDIAKNSSVHAVLANITDSARVTDVCRTFGVDTIYHAAAYKHVPLVEINSINSIDNNVFSLIDSKPLNFTLIACGVVLDDHPLSVIVVNDLFHPSIKMHLYYI